MAARRAGLAGGFCYLNLFTFSGVPGRYRMARACLVTMCHPDKQRSEGVNSLQNLYTAMVGRRMDYTQPKLKLGNLDAA